MKEQIEEVLEILKKENIDGCITGSCLLDYFEGQDVDVFVYNKQSLYKILLFMYYNPLFQILDPLELHKYEEFIHNDKSSVKQLGLITIKFKYNTCVDVNIVFREYYNTVFDVISNFDLDIIACGYDIKTKQTISLRKSVNKECNWNIWNSAFYKADQWNIKRLLRQFERVVKYYKRGYNTLPVSAKYIELVKDILSKKNIYTTQKGTKFHEDTQDQFEIVLKVLEHWQRTQDIGEKELLLLKTLI